MFLPTSVSFVKAQQLNPELTPFQRRFVTELKRCDEMERKLRLFRSALNTMGVSTTCLVLFVFQSLLFDSKAGTHGCCPLS
jgi:hypothetical protein